MPSAISGANRPAAVCGAVILLAAAGCDAGVERAAELAVERSRGAAPAPPKGPAAEIVETYVAQVAETGRSYDLALQAAEYELALAEGALTSSAEFAMAPDRLEAARAAARAHRDQALAQTDAAMAKLRGLIASRPEKAATAERLLAELAASRARRAQHWTFAEQIIDETQGAWDTLNLAEGDWALRPDGLKFTLLKDKEAYDAHANRIVALNERQERLIGEQARSVATLRALARQYGS